MRSFLSVIVCTYYRDGLLQPTLNSLIDQNYPIDRYEVILVDNNPTKIREMDFISVYLDETVPSDSRCQVHYIHFPILGLSNARNAGIAQAVGDIICFIDDDALAPPDWLEIIENAYLLHPQAGVIGGHILLEIPKPRPKILRPGFEAFWSHMVTNFTDYTEVNLWQDFPWGANWSARRIALNQIGGFKNVYGRRGDNYWGGEELVAAYEIRNLGYSIGIEPKSIVLHCVNPKRFSFVHLFRTILSEQFVRYQAHKDGYIALDKNDISIAKIRKQHLLPLSIKIMARLIVTLYKIIDRLRQK